MNGRRGHRYWVHDPYELVGVDDVDETLAGFPVAVFPPDWHAGVGVPYVVALQGMAAPWGWSAFLLDVLPQMGIGVAFVETPLAGERSLVKNFTGNPISEFQPLVERGIELPANLVARLMDVVSRDIQSAFQLVVERHGGSTTRQAIFGVSLGALYGSFAFMRDGIGNKMLCAIGMPDIYWFAKAFGNPGTWAVGVLSHYLGSRDSIMPARARTAGRFCRLLNTLSYGGEESRLANPMHYIDRVGPDRQMRLLVGDADWLCSAKAATACAARFLDGAAYRVPGMDHGGHGFVQHAQFYVRTQLGEWSTDNP